jgi:hypothetical protein
MRECGGWASEELESGEKGGLGAAEEGEGLCLGSRLVWWVIGRKAIWSFRLRLHSGVTTHASKERSLGARFFGRAEPTHRARCRAMDGAPGHNYS